MKLVIAILVVLASACGGDDIYPIERLQDPNTCMECHPSHFTQWSGSMHAYAADDPVFVAMNKRGQRETQGALGAFCIKCHAPMAVVNGTITDANAADFDPTALSPPSAASPATSVTTSTRSSPITTTGSCSRTIRRCAAAPRTRPPARRTTRSTTR